MLILFFFENCAFLGYYSASSGIPEERSSDLLRGGSLESLCIFLGLSAVEGEISTFSLLTNKMH